MRVGVIPENPLEGLALSAGLVPAPFLNGMWGLFFSRCLLVATRLGIFDALEAGPRETAALARALGVEQAGLDPMLKALNGFGLLHHRDGVWSLSRTSRRWLVRSAKASMRDAVLFLDLAQRWMAGLEDAVRTGQVRRIHEGGLTPEDWEVYLRGLAALARPSSLEVVRRVRPKEKPRRLLDVGGGHGLYSVAFCRRFPALEAEVLELPEAVKVGRQIVAEAGHAGRVRYRAGDMRTVDWGEGHDVVLVFNVLHNATEEESRGVMSRAFRALRPGGTLAILESSHRKTRGDIDAAGGFGELFHFLVSGARAWPEEVMLGWLKATGFEQTATSRLRLAPSVLLTACRPR